MSGNLIQPYNNGGTGNTIVNPYLPTQRASFLFWRSPVYQASDGTLWCPGADGETFSSNPWDYLYLGIPSTQPFTPGVCRLGDFEKARDIDKKKAAGNDGARVTIHGVDATVVNVEIRIWTPEQLKQLSAIWPVLFPTAYKGAPPAYDVQHPALAMNNIKSVQFIGGGGPFVDEKGMGIFRMRMIEFLKPGKNNATKTEVAAISSLLDPGAYPTPGSNSSNLGPL